MVCYSASDAKRDHYPYDAYPYADDDSELQGIIKLTPTHNDTASVAISEEMDHLVLSMTLNDVNLENVLKSVVVNASNTSYNSENIIIF